jgi:hypothetical protein
MLKNILRKALELQPRTAPFLHTLRDQLWLPLKYILSRHRLLPTLDLIRYLPECLNWLRHGACGIAPPPIKRWVIASYLNRFRLVTFVETGTYLGDTLALVAQSVHYQCISIELDSACYREVHRRFADYPNVRLLQGDSGALMPNVITDLRQPALFWLDGHYSGGITAKGDLETPVIAELQAIFASQIQGHVILIDDVRCFDGTHDYPYLDELLAIIRTDGRYRAEVSADILRLTPVSANSNN